MTSAQLVFPSFRESNYSNEASVVYSWWASTIGADLPRLHWRPECLCIKLGPSLFHKLSMLNSLESSICVSVLFVSTEQYCDVVGDYFDRVFLRSCLGVSCTCVALCCSVKTLSLWRHRCTSASGTWFSNTPSGNKPSAITWSSLRPSPAVTSAPEEEDEKYWLTVDVTSVLWWRLVYLFKWEASVRSWDGDYLLKLVKPVWVKLMDGFVSTYQHRRKEQLTTHSQWRLDMWLEVQAGQWWYKL